MNTSVLITVGVLALLFIILLVIRNKKDKKEVTDQIKQDYPKPKDDEGDIEDKDQMH